MTKTLIRSLAHKLGYEISRHRFGRHLDDDLKLLMRGIDAPVVFDVGANVGQTSLWYVAQFPLARVYAFEPEPDVFMQLKRSVTGHPRINAFNLGLGRADGSAVLNVMKNSVGSSFLDADALAPPYDWTLKQATVDVATRSLDSFCSEKGIAEIDLLKIDTQGFELAVLEGAAGMLKARAVRLVLLEANFVPLYEGQPSFSSLIDLLNSFGYQLVDFYNKYRNQDRLLAWCDAMFAIGSRSEEFSWK